MKKTLLLCMIFLVFFFKSVKASENKLYFIEQDNKIVYESDSEDYFMKHLDMLPGSNYTDELEIENGTKNKYTVYLKVDVKEQSVLAEELLDYITMKVYLDDSLVYNGNIRGLDYNDGGINFEDAVKLREFNPGDKSLLKVETELLGDYSNKDNNEIGKVDWLFYAQYEKNQPQVIDKVPKTDLNSNKIIISIVALILGIVLIGVYYVGKNNQFMKKKA